MSGVRLTEDILPAAFFTSPAETRPGGQVWAIAGEVVSHSCIVLRDIWENVDMSGQGLRVILASHWPCMHRGEYKQAINSLTLVSSSVTQEVTLTSEASKTRSENSL